MKHFFLILSIANFSLFSHSYDYDIVTIGAGMAGFASATMLGNNGENILVITNQRPGGLFRNGGDATFNSLLYFSYLYARLQKETLWAKKKLDFNFFWQKIDTIIQSMYSKITYVYAKDSGMQIVNAHATLLDQHTVKYNNTTVTAKKIILATGARPFIPEIKGLDSIEYYTYKTIRNITTSPAIMVIYGSGPQALTVARIFSQFGTKVYIVYRSKKILKEFDDDVTSLLQKLMKQDNVEFIDQTLIHAVENQQKKIAINTTNIVTQQEQIFTVDALYLATGTEPEIETLNLEAAGVNYNKKGISINTQFQTSVPHIYAVGDVTEYPHQSRYVTDCAKGLASYLGLQEVASYQKALSFSHARVLQFYPTLVAVGVSEKQAKKLYGKKYTVFKTPYKKNLKAILEGKTEGFVKIICDPENTIVGAQIIGEQAEYLLFKIPIGQNLFNKKVNFDVSMVTSYSYLDLISNLKQSINNKTINERSFLLTFWLYCKSFFTDV